MGSEQFFLTNSNGFEITNECGMGIRKTRLGTVRVLRGLNVNVTDGVAIRIAITSSLLPKLLFLSRFQIFCLTVRLGVRGHLLWPQDQGDGLEKTERKWQTIHSPDVYCASIVYSLFQVLGHKGEQNRMPLLLWSLHSTWGRQTIQHNN